MDDFAVDIGRVSFSWFRRVATRLDEPPWPGEWSWAGRSGSWRQEFSKLTAGRRGDLEVPWPSTPSGRKVNDAHRFWRCYAGGTDEASVTPRRAWKHFVPLRVKLGVRLSHPDWRWIDVQGRLYPFGVGVVVNAETRRSMSLDAFTQSAIGLRRDEVAVAGPGSTPSALPSPRRLNAVAGDVLGGLAHRLVGEHVEPDRESTPAAKAFSVVTVVSARGKVPPMPAHALETLTTWYSGSASQPAGTALAIPGQRAGDQVWATRRGRAVWRPSAFGSPTAGTQLSDLHRALTWMGLQIDSLGSFLRFFASDGELARDLSPVHLACRRHVGLLAGRLVSEAADDYRDAAASGARQLLDNYRDAADRVRALIGQQPLRVEAV